MSEYWKQYIALQKQFRETEGAPDSVHALYTFKEKLEQSEDQQAKEVLVNVYDLLNFNKDAYQPLCQNEIGRSWNASRRISKNSHPMNNAAGQQIGNSRGV